MTTPSAPRLTTTHWLIIVIAAIGFLFDTYELLMTPLVAAPAIAELLKVPQNNPLVTEWVGRLLWIAALCGGVFGLLGGWLVDRLGRKTVMALSIFVYSLSPFCAAYASSLRDVRLLPLHDVHRGVRGIRRRDHVARRKSSRTESNARNGSASRRRSPRSAACS